MNEKKLRELKSDIELHRALDDSDHCADWILETLEALLDTDRPKDSIATCGEPCWGCIYAVGGGPLCADCYQLKPSNWTPQ